MFSRCFVTTHDYSSTPGNERRLRVPTMTGSYPGLWREGTRCTPKSYSRRSEYLHLRWIYDYYGLSTVVGSEGGVSKSGTRFKGELRDKVHDLGGVLGMWMEQVCLDEKGVGGGRKEGRRMDVCETSRRVVCLGWKSCLGTDW